MNHANCLGGIEIDADIGYWRINKNATTLYKCLRKSSCNGGFDEFSEYPVE
jgi:hypothetical protein